MNDEDHKDYDMHCGASPIIFERARVLRASMTHSENRLWSEVKEKKILGLKFRRQHPMSSFIVDFYCHELKLAVEVDGGYHNGEEQKVLDIERSDQLRELGITIIRFSNEQVDEELQEVLEEIKSVVNRIRQS